MKSQILKKCFSYIRKEVVLSVSVLLAVASCFFVAPDKEYLSYIDWNTLALLFSLMAVIKGLQEADFFVCMAGDMLKKIKTTRTMLFLLVFMPFVFSMVVTNDVSLITFVPFGIAILKMAQMERLIVPQVVLQTVAANLGSMLTPMGNPQNLYLYNQSGIGFGRFCLIMLPYVAASALFLAAAILFIKNFDFSGVLYTAGMKNRKSLLFYAGGFVLCLLAVFKVLPSVLVAVIVAISLLVLDRKILKKVDYALLGTFFAFFIFVGNFARIEPVRNFLFSVLNGRVEIVSVITSQIISNVPAALLLSGFTSRWQSLIIGCNFGGLGTLIASMASLISYKIVIREYPGMKKRYFFFFTFLNVLFLILLFLVYILFQHVSL